MKKVFKLLTLGAAALAMVWGFPSMTQAGCPVPGPMAMCSSAAMSIVGTTNNSHFVDPNSGVGGSFWLAGGGNVTTGSGNDSGFFGKPVVDPTTFGAGDWMSDFIFADGSGPDRCIAFDVSAPYDGCLGALGTNPGQPSDIAVVVATDTNNNYAVFSAGGFGGGFDFDFIFINSGGAGTLGPMVPNGFGNVGMGLTRAVHVLSSGVAGGTATVNVAPLALNYFDDAANSRVGTLTVGLYGYSGGVWGLRSAGPAGGSVNVDVDSPLCWGFTTGEFVPSHISTGNDHLGVACVMIGGSTPSQHVDKAVASKSQGHMQFDWHVTAQLDIVGFDIVSIDPTKGQERKLNSSPIFQGVNDAQEANYSISFPRSVVKRPGVFELRMTRQDGTVTATTFLNE